LVFETDSFSRSINVGSGFPNSVIIGSRYLCDLSAKLAYAPPPCAVSCVIYARNCSKSDETP
jgi:hypothetical protein